jgi:hypothetical protein
LRWHSRGAIGEMRLDCFHFRQSAVQDGSRRTHRHRLEEFDIPGALALAVVLLVFSFALLAAINVLEQWAGNLRRDERHSS